MSEISVDQVSAALQGARVSQKGVSFEGKSLKLNSEDDAKPVVEAIRNAEELEFLNLEGNTLGVEAARAIAKALEKHSELKRALWKDMFTGRMKTEIPKALEYLGNGLVAANAHLTELDLSDNAFGPIGVEGLASLLRSSSCYALEELRLNNNGLGITGGKLLAGALLDCYNSSKAQGKPFALKVFVAGRNRLENDGAKALAEVFKTIGSLEEVVMPQNGISHIGIAALSEAFTHNKNLEILNLNDNTFGLKGANAIATALPNIQKLKSINFGDCLLKTKGALALASSLKSGHGQLEELILDSNEIRSEGGVALAEAMSNKVKLKRLILEENPFGKEGVSTLKLRMITIGRSNALGSLNECTSDDDDEEEEEGSEQEEEEEVSDEEPLEITEVTDSSVNIHKFLKDPNIHTFMELGDNPSELILNEVKTKDDYLNALLPIVMKVASFTTNNQDKVAASSLKCCKELFKDLFNRSKTEMNLSLVNNSLLVHLGFIKSEDKKFKVSWNVEGCLVTLQNLVKANVIPGEVKDTLAIFVEREILKNTEYQAAKKNLLAALK